VPVKAAWNEGATYHMDDKAEPKTVTHAGAGGDNEEFEAWFNQITGAKTQQAGGDESNLEDRVASLEAKLVALESSKAGGGKSCFDCCSYHIGGNHPAGAADGADEAALTKAKQDNTNLLGYCKNACNGTKEIWESKLNILKCCYGNTNGQC